MYSGSHSGRPARRDTTLFGPPALQDTALFGLYATVLSRRTRGDELESPVLGPPRDQRVLQARTCPRAGVMCAGGFPRRFVLDGVSGLESSRAPTTVRSTEAHLSSGDSPAQNSVSPSSRLETSVETWKILEGAAKPRSGVLTEEVG
ncbi:hypothetical protein TNCV_4953411 [Trichonephila clavipes]|nr:hypothetical protein TNCV_4953411 [Trichonephila clavipes]